MRLFSYKMTHDTGFAPNPFFECLTLATCKPGIRRTKRKGDWIAGFASDALVRHAARMGHRVPLGGLVYLMNVAEVLSIADYFRDRRFSRKIPSPHSRNKRARAGDNIYEPSSDGVTFSQLPNDNHDEGNMTADLSGKNVLVAKEFYYFGRNCVELPNSIGVAIPQTQSAYGVRTHSEAAVAALLDYIRSRYGVGLHGLPCLWGPTDQAGGCQ